MSQYKAEVIWQRSVGEIFSDNQYSRGHLWRFDGGVEVPASSSPHVVPLPYSVEENVDPEEAFIAAISSCHMLTFLGIAAKQRYTIESYHDHAIGLMNEDDQGYSSVSHVTLKPTIKFSGDKRPNHQQLEKLHQLAHRHCFIANSVNTIITTEIQDETE